MDSSSAFGDFQDSSKGRAGVDCRGVWERRAIDVNTFELPECDTL